MHRLKEMEKTASIERKIMFKEQKRLIKHHLSINKEPTKIKFYTPRERKVAGPLKVHQNHSESIDSEIYKSATLGEKSCTDTPDKHSSKKQAPQHSEGSLVPMEIMFDVNLEEMEAEHIRDEKYGVIPLMKKTLQTKEAALQRRRKAVEDLMKWHRRLLEEEMRISELEAIAKIIVYQTSNKFTEDYGECSHTSQKMSNTTDLTSNFSKTKISDNMCENIAKTKHAVNPNIKIQLEEYHKLQSNKENIPVTSSELDIESDNHIVNSQDFNVLECSINELINNFCRIKKDLSVLGMKESVKPVRSNESLLLNNDFKGETKISENEKIISDVTLNPSHSISATEKSLTRSSQNELTENSKFEAPSEDKVVLEEDLKEFQDKQDDKQDRSLLKDVENVVKCIEIPLTKSIDGLIDPIPNKLSILEISKSSVIKDNLCKTETDLIELSQTEDVSSIEVSDDTSFNKKNTFTDEPLPTKYDEDCFQEAVNVHEELSFDGIIHLQNTISPEKEHFVEIYKGKEITSNKTDINDKDILNDTGINQGVTGSEEGLNYNPSVAKEEMYINPVVVIGYKTNVKEIKPPLGKESTLIEETVSNQSIAKTIATTNKCDIKITELEEKSEENLEQSESHIYAKLTPNSAVLWKDTLSTKESIDSHDEENHDYNSLAIIKDFHTNPPSIKEQTAVTVEQHSFGNSNEKLSPIVKPQEDVEKPVLEIVASSHHSAGEAKHLKLDDFSTYDLSVSVHSSKLGSPIENQKLVTDGTIFDSEAEEILKKQLAIEQEIKKITEEQKKEQLPLLFARDIPNKPPPPYTPPSPVLPASVNTIVPTPKEIEEITKYSAKILHKAYLSNNLDIICISENTLSLVSKNVTKECYKFVFDLCKEISKEHSKQFEKEICSSWLQVIRDPQLAAIKPLHINGLENYIQIKLQEIFQYTPSECCENAILKWNQKKRDHVDEILVTESLAEEALWTNYDKDELYVKNDITKVIMDVVLRETVDIYMKILTKRSSLS